jgi:hypothetical protein
MATVDEIFPEQGRSVDDLFPADVERERFRQTQLHTSPVQDLIFGDTSVNPVARVLDAFGQGVRHAWGSHNDTVSKESEDFLKASKQYDEWSKSQTGISKAANEVLFRPAASQLYREFKDVQAIFHGIGAGIEGTKAAIAQIGTEVGQEKLGKEVAAGFEAFPSGFRQPAGTFPRMTAADYIREVERAKDLKTVGAGEAGYQGTADVPAPALKEVAPIVREEAEAARPMEAKPAEPAVAPPVEAAPEVPVEQPARVTSAPIDESHPIAQDVAGRLMKAGRPADEAAASAQIIAAHYETRAARFGGALGTAEELYKREGAEIRPGRGVEPAPAEVKPEPKPLEGGAVETPSPDGLISNDPSWNRTASWVIRNKDTKEVVMETFDPKKVEALNTNKYEAVPIGEYLGSLNKEARTAAEDGQPTAPSRVGLGDNIRRGAYQDWSPGRIVKVGFVDGLKVEGVVPAEYAGDAAGFIVTKGKNVYRVTPHQGIAKLFGEDAKNALETAQSTAKRELEFEQVKRGKIRFNEDAKPVITLFKDANESTFIHETGHHWLEELMRDAKHEKAPTDLIADSKAVLDWFGVDDASKIKTRHHEQFARGFERYVMEGVAPSRELASVFAKFKDWLTRIYEAVTRLKSPINDEIRGVFDRMLAIDPQRVKIEPEAPKNFADIHAADAIDTPPAAARPVAETIRAERDRLAAEQFPEENDARLEGVTSGTGRREAGGPQPLRDRNASEPGPAEARGPEASGEVRASGGDLASEGARPSAQPRTESPVSAQSAFEPSSPLMDKAGNIRLENLNTSEDVKQVIRESAERNSGFMDDRRNVVSDGDAMKLADAMGLRVEDLNRRQIGEAWNKEQIFALEKLLIDASTAVRDAMASGDEVAYVETVARFKLIQETVQAHASGVRAEAGRALQAYAALKKIPGREGAIGLGDFLQENTGKTLFQLQREMKLGAMLETPADVAKFVTEAAKPKWSDKLIELWMSFLLSGPVTHAANMMGNTITDVIRPIETSIAAGIGKARNLVTGTNDRVFIGEAKAELFGMIQGAREGVVAAKKAFQTEEPQLTSATQTERSHQKAMGSFKVNIAGKEVELGGKQLRIPLRMLGAEDELFKAAAFRGDINRQAYAIASKEGLPAEQFHRRVADLAANPTDEMIEAAKKVADYQTFQTPLGKVGRAMQAVSNAAPPIKIIFPFVRTPLNLLKYASERTPLGIWSREVRDNLSGKNGAVARDTQMARITLGTLVGVAAYSMAAESKITGGGPSDPKEKAALKMTGWQEYSIKIGDHYYSYRRLDPFSTILGVVADAYEISHKMTAADAEKHNIPALVMGAITKTLLDKASLKGASDFIQAATQWDRFGDGYVRNLTGTIVPAFSNQTAKAIDPVVRQTRTVLDNLKSRIPGLSQTLMPKRDVWGEPMTREGGLGPDIVSPISESRLKNDPVNKALLAANYFPGKLDRKIRGVELTDQQYDDYTRIAGRTAKMRLDTIVQMPGFAQMPETVRKDLMTKAITTSREMARSLIMMQNPDILKRANDAKMATR